MKTITLKKTVIQEAEYALPFYGVSAGGTYLTISENEKAMMVFKNNSDFKIESCFPSTVISLCVKELSEEEFNNFFDEVIEHIKNNK